MLHTHTYKCTRYGRVYIFFVESVYACVRRERVTNCAGHCIKYTIDNKL